MTVRFAGQSKSAVTDANGDWMIRSTPQGLAGRAGDGYKRPGGIDFPQGRLGRGGLVFLGAVQRPARARNWKLSLSIALRVNLALYLEEGEESQCREWFFRPVSLLRL